MTAKYIIYATIEVDGIVEEPDVIGAIFGQTEGLLGDELDLRELQKSGRIGRIKVKLDTKNNKSVGIITIPSNLDRIETALIAATLESVDKVGPYDAKIRVSRIEDSRVKKRRWIIERAKEILRQWEVEKTPDLREIVEEIQRAIRVPEIIKWGPDKLPAGPDIDRSNTIILVEGRADVINLVKHGYRNVIAIGGVNIPKSIIDLCKNKTVIAFVDGDRAGELILRNLLQTVKIDYVARAPPGKEVEELSAKEIVRALRNKIPAKEYLESLRKKKEIETKAPPSVPIELLGGIPQNLVDTINELQGTLEAILYDNNWNVIKKVPVRDLINVINETENVYAIVFDGIVTQRVLDEAFKNNVKVLIAARLGEATRIPENIKILTFDQVKSALKGK